MIVVDTNVLAYAVLPGDSSELALRLSEIDPDWLSPALWRHEFANVLATRMRSHGLSLAGAVEAFATAEQLVIDGGSESPLADRLELAQRGGISAYDAEFVALAELLNLPLITHDRKLARAFPGRAIALEEFAAS